MLAMLVDEVAAELDAIQGDLLRKASEALAKNTHSASTVAEIKKVLSENGGIVQIPWCGNEDCEVKLREGTGGKILNIPLDQKAPKGRCPVCSKDATAIANFGKSY